jgi:hypothetical protein
MMPHAIEAELRHIAFAIQRLGKLRDRLDYAERLRISNLMRDVSDDLDRGDAGRLLSWPSSEGAAWAPNPGGALFLEEAAQANTVLVRVRPRTARQRVASRPAARRP